MKWVVRWLVVSLVMQGTALAQGQGDRTSAPPVQEKECAFRTVLVSAADWQAMTHEQRLEACAQGRQAAAYARALGSSEPFNRKLGIAGGVVALVGLILITPQGDDVRVLGDQYCVGESYVDYGTCPSASVKYGLYFLAAGGTMAFIGFHQVSVSPMVGPQVKGVKATVRWGGK